jgi:adenylate kinase
MKELQVIRLFGPYGSGKGTQAKLLSQNFDAPVFDTGSELRDNIKNNTAIGIKVKSVIDKGELVTNDIILDLIKNWLASQIKKGNKAIILDGTSRELEQAKLIDQYLSEELQIKNITNIHIKIPRDESILRQTQRRICNYCGEIFPYAYKKDQCNKCGKGVLEIRKENDPLVAEKRADIFEAETLPVLEYYQSKKALIEIDGLRSIEDVTNSIMNVFK